MPSFPKAIQVDYPITRPFPWKWFGVLSYAGALVVVVFLVLANVVLVGYDTINRATNSTTPSVPRLWYHEFLPTYRTTPKCDPAVYRLGDTFRTNFSLFEWKLEGYTDGFPYQSFEYKDQPLTNCRLLRIEFWIQPLIQQIELSPFVQCTLPGIANVSLSAHSKRTLLGISSGSSGIGSIDERPGGTDTPLYDSLATIESISLSATHDIDRMTRYLLDDDVTPPTAMATDALYCFGNADEIDPSCATGVATIKIFASNSAYANGTTEDVRGGMTPTNYTSPVHNLAQVIAAAVMIDLGDINYHNNIFLNQSIVNDSLIFPPNEWYIFPPSLYDDLVDPEKSYYVRELSFRNSTRLPLRLNTGSSIVQSTYLCQFQQRKGVGSLIISVLVATLSMMGSAWALYLLIASMLVKRFSKGAWRNHCEGVHNAIAGASSHSTDGISELSRGVSDRKERGGSESV